MSNCVSNVLSLIGDDEQIAKAKEQLGKPIIHETAVGTVALRETLFSLLNINSSLERDVDFNSVSFWGEPNALEYVFDTAWGAPAEAIIKLSTQYPELKITMRSDYEDGGWELYEYDNGKSIEVDGGYGPASHADHTGLGEDCLGCNDGDQDSMYDDCPEKDNTISVETRDDVEVVA